MGTGLALGVRGNRASWESAAWDQQEGLLRLIYQGRLEVSPDGPLRGETASKLLPTRAEPCGWAVLESVS